MTEFFDHELERQVIAGALLGELAPLDPGNFHDHRHKAIWKSIMMVMASGGTITPEAVEIQMGDGGDLYLYEILTHAGSLMAIEAQAERIRDLSRRRGMKTAMEQAMGRIIQGDPTEDIGYDLQRAIHQLGYRRMRADPIDLSDVVEEVALRRADPVDVWGMRTGIYAIDIMFGGLHKNEVLLIAGEPGMGKTMFVTQLGFQLAGLTFWPDQVLNRHPGVIYELEMTSTALQRRAICGLARVSHHDLMTGKIGDEDFDRAMAATDRIQKAPVYISDATDWTTTSMAADVARLIDDHGIEWVVVDYAGLLKDRAPSRIDHEMIVSQNLHDIAKMGVALIIVDTLNKSGLRGERGLGAVRGSVQKTYDADVVAFLERNPDDDDKKSPARQLRFTKAREADMFQVIPIKLVGPQKRFEPLYEGMIDAHA